MTTEAPELIEIEVAFALPDEQQILKVKVPRGTSALDVVRQSGILALFPMIDIATARMGVFSRLLDGKTNPLPQDYLVAERDRIEIYRPLLVDPNQARLRRAKRAQQSRKAAR